MKIRTNCSPGHPSLPGAVLKVLLIVNPSASGVTARNRVVIQNAFAAAHHLDVAETNRRGHATRLAQGATAAGVELVITLGGDGTVNEVANGLARTDVAMGVLPGGSTNVFARTLGLTNEPVAAANELLNSLDRGPDVLRKIGLGNVNGRFFCFHVGMGYDAAVVAEVEKRGTLKRWLGHPLFITAAVSTWARGYDRSAPAFCVDIGGGELPTDGLFAIVMNTDPYTYLGPRPLSLIPELTLDDPLGLVNLRGLTLSGTLRAVVAALRGGRRLERLGHVDIHTGLQSITVRGHRPFPWQVDGDHLGDTELLNFRFEPECLTLVVPSRHAHPSEQAGA